ncbi:hypothetical protein [Actinomadura sp. 9N215]|uniref:hypothetical protein n=1 Tax=Actinomadura sp. 9N215 TaxID=3375150 RepID=UPI00378D2FC5
MAGWLLAYARRTRDAYARDLAKWLACLAAPGGTSGSADGGGAGRDPLAVRRGDADDAYTRPLEQGGASPATVRRKLAAVSSFYTYAEEGDAPARSPRRHRAWNAPPGLVLTITELADEREV